MVILALVLSSQLAIIFRFAEVMLMTQVAVSETLVNVREQLISCSLRKPQILKV